MNWLNKISSVTFQLEQGNRIAQPKTISNIANGLYSWALNYVPRSYFGDRSFQMIDMDGLDLSSFTGTINWYVKTLKLANDIPMYVDQWTREEMLPLGIYIRLGKLEQSKMFKEMLVQRIHIITNQTEELSVIPEINISNANTKSLFMMLNLPVSQEGEINLEELKQRIKNVSNVNMTEFTRDNAVDKNNINFGLNTDDLKFYLERLTKIIDFGLNNGFSKILWN